MNNSYHMFHVELLKQTYNQLLAFSPFCKEDLETDDEEFLQFFHELILQTEHHEPGYIENGQVLMGRLIRAYPELTPLMPRDLLWFFGGDCLHYMPDDELQLFQQLDEARYVAESRGEIFEYSRERAITLKLAH